MVQMSVRSNVGDSGYATVRTSKNSVVISFAESGIKYELPLDLWEAGRQPGDYNITLSRNNDKIVGVKPIQGTYLFKFNSMGNRIGETPEPAIQRGGPRQSKDGKKRWIQPDSLVWRVNLEVESEGKYQGLKVMYTMNYIFASIPGSPNTQFLANSRRDLENVETFLRVAGFNLASREIPFSPNVLPWLERELLDLDVTFMGKVDERGFFSEPSTVPAELLPKKTNKKAKK